MNDIGENRYVYTCIHLYIYLIRYVKIYWPAHDAVYVLSRKQQIS